MIVPPLSPYSGSRLSVWVHFALSSFWFGTNFLWGALLVVVIPAEVPRLAPGGHAMITGLLVGAGAIVPMIVPLIAGPLSDRCTSRWGRRRPYIVVGVAVNLIGLALMAWASQAQHLASFAISYLVVQLGNNVATGPYSGIIPDLVPDDQRGVASGWMGVMSQFGTLCGGVASGLLFDARQFLLAYGVIGIALALTGVATIFGLMETPLVGPVPRLDVRSYIRSLWIDPRKHPDFFWVWITRAFVMLGFYAPLPFLQNYLRDVVQVADPAAEVPKVMAVILLFSSLTGVWGGAISERVGRKPVIYVANGLIAVMAFAFPFCRSLEHVLLVGAVFGLAYGAYISVDWALGTDVLPNKHDAAKDMAIWHISMTAPQTIGAPLAGLILTSFGYAVASASGGENVEVYSWNGYASLFAFAGGCFLLGAVLLRNVRGAR